MEKDLEQSRKRFRIPVSCRACRKRKTKVSAIAAPFSSRKNKSTNHGQRHQQCDRSKPRCDYCTKNNLECVYEDSNSWEDISATKTRPMADSVVLQAAPASAAPPKSGGDYARRLERELFELRNKISDIESKIAVAETHKSKTTVSVAPELPRDHPAVSPKDVIDFYARYYNLAGFSKMSPQSTVIFSWKTMIKKDPFIQILWLKLLSSPEKMAVISSIQGLQRTAAEPITMFDLTRDANVIPSEMLDVPPELHKHRPQLRDTSSIFKDTTDYSEAEKDENVKSISQKINQSSNPVGTHFTMIAPRVASVDQLKELVLAKLPNTKVLWMLIDRFFKYVYPFMPYIDENSFIKIISKVIGERTDAKYDITDLHINNKLEVAHLGILLFALEFASLSLASNDPGFVPDDSDTEYLLRHPIKPDNGAAAKYCFAQFKTFRHVSLEILQLAIYKRLFAKYSPVGGDGVDVADAQVFNGLLLQMAVALGLNRDSDAYGCGFLSGTSNPVLNETVVIPEHIANLKRKIWLFIVMNDSYHSSVLSGCSSTRIDFYDTTLPRKPAESNRNSNRDDVEMFVYESAQQFHKYDQLLKGFIYDILSFKPSNAVTIMTKVAKFEEVLKQDFNSLSHILIMSQTSDSDYLRSLRKVFTLNQYIELKGMLYLIYYHLFVHYEAIGSNDQVALYYLYKVAATASEISESLPSLLLHLRSYVGHGFDYFLTPILELTFHKTVQFKYGLQFRLRQLHVLSRFNNSVPPDLITKVESVSKLMQKSYLKSIKALVSITHRYYYAWKLCKFQRICILILADKSDPFEVCSDGDLYIKGDMKYLLKPPQSSLLSRTKPEEVRQYLQFLVSKFESKPQEVPPSLYGNAADSIIFDRGQGVGLYANKTSTHVSEQDVTDSSSGVNGSSKSMSMSSSSLDIDSPTYYTTNPDTDKWWMDFLTAKASAGKVPYYTEVNGAIEATDAASLKQQPVQQIPNSVSQFDYDSASVEDYLSDNQIASGLGLSYDFAEDLNNYASRFNAGNVYFEDSGFEGV